MSAANNNGRAPLKTANDHGFLMCRCFSMSRALASLLKPLIQPNVCQKMIMLRDLMEMRGNVVEERCGGVVREDVGE